MFSQEFPEITVQYLLHKIKDIIISSKVTLETVFNDFCSDKVQKRMNAVDFKRFVKKYVPKAVDHEISTFHRHF